jgi:hypothetical protein
LFIFCLVTYVQAQEPYYVELFGGANFLPTKKYEFSTGYNISGSFGYRLCGGISLEAEYAFRRNEAKKARFSGRDLDLHGCFKSSALMGNILYELPYAFIGAGVGLSSQKVNVYDAKETKVRFAWQLLAGVDYPTWYGNVSLQYKYHQGGFAHFHNHTIGIGTAYYFD